MTDNIQFVDTIGYRVFSDDLGKIPVHMNSNCCKVINTISPNSYGVSTKDEEFKIALKTTDYLVLDGVYFAFSSLLLQGKNIKANQGWDVFQHFMGRLQANKGKAFFLGSSESTLEKIKENARTNFPDIVTETFSPPYKPEFSDEENDLMVQKINNFKPDIVFVGMTCPKQEKWAIKHRGKVDAGLMIAIGNVFDWFAGTQKPIAKIWYRLKLVWLVRIFVRPEIFRRNIGNQMKFFWHVILIFLKLKKYD